MNTAYDKEIRHKLLKLLENEPKLTQREMNERMGVSLGKINYCISALAEKGMIRIERLKKNPNKRSYMYRLTPKGFEELAQLTIDFLKLRLVEYEKIKDEIKMLTTQIQKLRPETRSDVQLSKELQKNK